MNIIVDVVSLWRNKPEHLKMRYSRDEVDVPLASDPISMTDVINGGHAAIGRPAHRYVVRLEMLI